MERVIRLRAADLAAERHPAAGTDDVHFPRALAVAVVERCTVPGQRVLDPFAGWGTTLLAAADLGRVAVGVELLPERCAAVERQLVPPHVVHRADARELATLGIAPADLCFTSPPYMTAVDHPENPLTGYRTRDGDYARYLDELTGVLRAAAGLLRPGGHLVVNAANIRDASGVTTLAWDLTAALRPHLTFHGETHLEWDDPPPAFTGDYLLDFTVP